MNIYMISYDLHSPTSNRENVENCIKSVGTWCKYVSTTFLVKSNYNIESIQEIVTKNLNGNDYMIITKVQKPIKGCLSEDQWKWISTNL